MGYKATRHPILKQYAVTGQWCREAAEARVPGYPRTEAGWRRLRDHLATVRANARAKGTLNHAGIPPGWAGRRPELAEISERCHSTATETVKRVPDWDEWDARAQLCLTAALEIALNPTVHASTRATAMATVLEYTQPKPAKQTDIVISEHRRPGSNRPPLSATEWLAKLGGAAGVEGIVAMVKEAQAAKAK